MGGRCLVRRGVSPGIQGGGNRQRLGPIVESGCGVDAWVGGRAMMWLSTRSACCLSPHARGDRVGAWRRSGAGVGRLPRRTVDAARHGAMAWIVLSIRSMVTIAALIAVWKRTIMVIEPSASGRRKDMGSLTNG